MPSGNWIYDKIGGGSSGGGGTAPVVIGFIINFAVVDTNVGPMLAAPRDGSFTKCVAVVKNSDSMGLIFTIRKNGTVVFSTNPNIAAGTAAGTVFTFTTLTASPLPVAANDVFSIDIISGSANWQFSTQLE